MAKTEETRRESETIENLPYESQPGTPFLLLVVLGSVLIIVFAFFAPVLFTQPGSPDFSKTGGIGDTINGLMAPFIAIAAAFLTFAAFYIQYKANQIQIGELKRQEELRKVESFERMLFDLVAMHRENVKELRVVRGTSIHQGQDAIKYMVELLQEILARMNDNRLGTLPDSQIEYKLNAVTAYLFLFFGNRMFNNSQIREEYIGRFSEAGLRDVATFTVERNERSVGANGFGMMLSRYFRHMFQIAKFIAEHENVLKRDMYFYGKVLRSTLSNEEQILLFYNALSPLGSAWVDTKYITKYKYIKNIPIYFIRGYKPSSWFHEDLGIPLEKISEYFESLE